jgi:hypothetical protein
MNINRKRLGTPSVRSITEYWQREWPSFVDDPEDPSCFACKVFPGDDDWPRLQRCHIVAHSAGGSSQPSNFLILCEDCHRAAPMTTDRTLLVQWVHERPSWLQIWMEMALEAVKKAGIQLEKVGPINQREFEEFAYSRKLDFHPHSTRLDKMVCIAYLLREYLDTLK